MATKSVYHIHLSIYLGLLTLYGVLYFAFSLILDEKSPWQFVPTSVFLLAQLVFLSLLVRTLFRIGRQPPKSLRRARGRVKKLD